MNAAGPVVAPALMLATACGSQPATTPPTAAPAGAVRADLDDERTAIPRVTGDDVALPFTTRTTVLENNRPATVVTFSEAVLFDFGSAELRPEAEAALAGVAEVFRLADDNPIAFLGEAGYQAGLLTPGLRFKVWPVYSSTDSVGAGAGG